MRRKASLVFATAILSLGIMQAAWAVGGTVSIAFNPDTEDFRGKVRSPEGECRINRAVKIFEITVDGRVLQGKDRTNDVGGWKIHLMGAEGNYIAIAPRYEAMNATCNRLASKTLDVM